MELSSAVNEVWYRYYLRFSNTITGDPTWKFNYADQTEWRSEFLGGDGISLLSAGITNPSSDYWHKPDHSGDASCGGSVLSNSLSTFATINGGSTGDGLWHAYETHYKRETSGCDGVFEEWVDGVLVNQHTNVCYQRALLSWQLFSNGQGFTNGGWADVDDYAISTNGYIGLLGGGSAPVLTYPAAGATVGMASGVTFSWVEVSGAVLYQLMVATDAGFTNAVADVLTSETTYNATNLSPGTHYYWRQLGPSPPERDRRTYPCRPARPRAIWYV
jgi:hypothetical protein